MRSWIAVVVVAGLAAALASGCAGSGDDGPAAGAATADHVHGVDAVTDHDGHVIGTVTYEGGTVSPVRTAPPLSLTNGDGETIDIRDLRGDPVLVTFVYATCPDVCPLIMSSLAQARRDAGAAGGRARVIAVSVDPEGDTPAAVRSFMQRRGVGGFVDYLVGSRAELEATWADWGVATEVPTDNPELIEHTSLIYGVNSSGELVTAYPVGFDPAAVARDLPRLART